MEIGTKIRQLRYKASLTQEQLADRLGVSPQAVSKWENAAAMPDISLLPALAETFGISIDDLFDLTAEQKYRRIESRMELEEELDPEIFREYEEFLKEQLGKPEEKGRAAALLAHLYHHRLESCAGKADRYARESISLEPDKKECQWILQKAEGGVTWDWNVGNHSKTIAFYKQVVEKKTDGPKTPLPYYYLIDNLIADHRTEEAAAYLRRFEQLPGHRPFMVPVYEAAIALAAYDEKRADAIMEQALETFGKEPDFLFEAAQYYARKCRYDKAIAYYEAAFSSEENEKPRMTDALEGIAAVYEILGEYGKAADTQRRILEVLKQEWGFTEETVVRETEEEIKRLSGK